MRAPRQHQSAPGHAMERPAKSAASPSHAGLQKLGNQGVLRLLQSGIRIPGVGGAGRELPFADTIQRSFGHHDVRGVRAHLGAAAGAASEELGARAFTTGQDVAFAGTPSLRTAAHEAAHAVQQRAGVRSAVGAAGDEHELHADRVADAVVRGASAEALLDQAPPGRPALLQREAKPGATVAPATLPEPSRLDRQRVRATELREMYDGLRAVLKANDAALPATQAYQAMVQVRDAVVYDLSSEIDDAEDALDVIHPVTPRAPGTTIVADHGFHQPVNLPYPDYIHDRLERATLTAYLLPIYTSLASLVRGVEIDRLVPTINAAVSAEADDYARAFDLLANPATTGSQLARVRTLVSAQVEHTRALLAMLKTSIKKGEKATQAVEHVEKVIDVPIDFAKGLIVPPQVLLGNLVLDQTAFALAHKAQFSALIGSVPSFLAELLWIRGHAPAVRQYVLNPLFKEVGVDSLKSVGAGEVAFAIGRIIKTIVEHQGADEAAGKVAALTWKLAISSTVKVAILVSILDSPVFVSRGIGKLADETSERILTSIGGDKDPHGVVKKVNETLSTTLTAPEVAELLHDLGRPEVQEHLRYLSDATAVVGPNMAAILADLTGTGMTSGASIEAGLANTSPLLSPAP